MRYEITKGVTVLGRTSTVTTEQLEAYGANVRALIKSGAIRKPAKKSKKAVE